MSIAQENTATEKQWDVKTIVISAVPQSLWGIKPNLIPQFVQLYGKEAIDDIKEGQGYLNLSFNKLKKLVAFLHRKGYDTSNLSEAVQKAINDALAERNNDKSDESQADRKEQEEFSERELSKNMQLIVGWFGDVDRGLRIHTDGEWGQKSQKALDLLLQIYHLPSQRPSEGLLKQLQALSSRIVCLGCTDADLLAAIKNNPFCITTTEGNGYKIERKGVGGVLQKMGENEEVIEFPTVDHSYFASDYYTHFSAWLMLLNMKAEKRYHDFCDLWIKPEEESDWQAIEQPSAEEQKWFAADADTILHCNNRSDLALSVKCIPRTNFRIDVIAVYLSGQMAIKVMHDFETAREPEVGRQFFFPADAFFEEPTEEQKALAKPLVKADFIKLFVVRGNRVLRSQDNEAHDYGTGLSNSFYQLITAPADALLATLTIGLDFKGPQDNFEAFKAKVEALYKASEIIEHDDLQKGRWGGQASRNGLRLNATVAKSVFPGFYSVKVTVHSIHATDEPLDGYVAFFLHDSFPEEIKYVKADGGVATLDIDYCYEAFTLAAYTENETTLELDLNNVSGFPKKFYWNDTSDFRDAVKKIYRSKQTISNNDLQKGRWGGHNASNGRTLTATVDASWIPGFYNVRLKVSLGDTKIVRGEVAFFLHERIGAKIRFAPVKDGVAELKIRTYQAFTAGAYTEDGTELELDLNETAGFPKEFYRQTLP